MTNVSQVFPEAIVPHSTKIKKITAPLQECLGISTFSYGSVDTNGLLVGLGNNPEIIEIYHETKGYLIDPHISHPHLLRSGVVFMPDAFGGLHLQPVCQQGKVRHLLLILENSGDLVECYHFGIHGERKEAEAHLCSHIDVLKRFIRYFKREAKPIIEKERKKGFNIRETRGKTFTENDFPSPLWKKDPKIQKFLKLVMPLTAREIECLELFQQGHSAQTTGVLLGLSPRTVEFYFENIKNKLGCQYKDQLLHW